MESGKRENARWDQDSEKKGGITNVGKWEVVTIRKAGECAAGNCEAGSQKRENGRRDQESVDTILSMVSP